MRPLRIDKNWVDPRNQNNDFFSVNSWKIGPLKLRKQADYNNVMQHLNKIPGEIKEDEVLSEKDVIKFLSIGERSLFFYTNYSEKLSLLHDNLHVTVDPDEPFEPIPDFQMAVYLAMVNEQHPKNSMLA